MIPIALQRWRREMKAERLSRHERAEARAGAGRLLAGRPATSLERTLDNQTRSPVESSKAGHRGTQIGHERTVDYRGKSLNPTLRSCRAMIPIASATKRADRASPIYSVPQGHARMNESEQQVAVVTGATGGIGRWIALGLARAGHHVVMIARDPARGNAAAAWIGLRVPGSSIEVKLADLEFAGCDAARRPGDSGKTSTRRAARQQCGYVHRASAGHGRRPRARAGGESSCPLCPYP